MGVGKRGLSLRSRESTVQYQTAMKRINEVERKAKERIKVLGRGGVKRRVSGEW
jgi:hypothetical protein